jgi:hypothetical protein
MKTKMLMAAFMASAALIAPAQAGNGHHSGGGGNSVASSGGVRGGGGPAPSFRSMPSGRFGGGGSFRSMPVRSFNSNPMVYSGQRFSSQRFRSPGSTEFRSRVVNSNVGGSFPGRQFTPGNISRADRVQRFSNAGTQSIANMRHDGNNQFRNGANQFRNGGNQVRNGNQRLRPDWHNHVFAQHSANWHRDWDRNHDHWWNGHRCHFFNGSWVIFDIGFYPWWPWWWDYPYYGYGYNGYPYDYGYYPNGYAGDYGYGYNNTDPGAYDNQYGYQNSYGDQSANSTVAAAQDRLAREGYYRGQIDGVLGPETRHAIVRFQTSRSLRINGELNSETLNALGLRQYASY